MGKIEQLTDDPELKTNSFDVVVYVYILIIFISSLLFRSNCVVNLSPDKKKVLQQVYEMLKVSYLDAGVDSMFVVISSLEVNYTSVMSTLIDQYRKNYDKTRYFGVRFFWKEFSYPQFFVLKIGECLSGALCESDLISSALEIGFTRPILVTQQPIGVSNKDLEKLIGQTFIFFFELMRYIFL